MGEDRGGWCTKVGRGSMGLVYGEVSEHGGIVFWGHMAFKEGEGNQIIFWYDLWSGHLFQKDLYPDLFECAVDKEALVADVLDSLLNKEVRSWNLQFHSDFHDQDSVFLS